MSKSVVPKLGQTASNTWTHNIGHICFAHLCKGHLVQIPFMSSYCNHIAIHAFYNVFVYVKLHFQPFLQKLAHQEQVGL